jgi:hypothetical protein
VVLATGSDEKVDSAAEIMSHHGGLGTEETSGPEPYLPSPTGEREGPTRDTGVQTGRIRQPSEAPAVFVW